MTHLDCPRVTGAAPLRKPHNFGCEPQEKFCDTDSVASAGAQNA